MSWLPEDNNLAFLGNGFTHAERQQDWANTTDYMDWEDESTVLLVENPKFSGPKLHEEVYRYAEVNPGVLDLGPQTDGAEKPSNLESQATAPASESSQTKTGEKASEANGQGKTGTEANDVQTGLAPAGDVVTLGEKVNENNEPVPNGHVEVRLPGDDKNLSLGEVQALNRNL